MENGRLCDSYLGDFPERRTWKSARRTEEPKTDKAATGPREKKEARCARRVGDVALTTEDTLMFSSETRALSAKLVALQAERDFYERECLPPAVEVLDEQIAHVQRQLRGEEAHLENLIADFPF